MEPLISIITPTFNRSNLIPETLDSILSQTYSNWECILIDDGSTDSALQILNEYASKDNRFKCFSRPDYIKKGASGCHNYGVEKSQGEFIQFFDSDDVMHPQHLELKMQHIGDNDLVVSKVQMFSGEFTEKEFNNDTTPNLIFPEDIFMLFVLEEFPMCMVAPMWKRESLLPYLPTNVDVTMLEDRELHTRILYDKPSFSIINRSLIFYRQNMASMNTDFNSNVDIGLASTFIALKPSLQLSKSNRVKYHILKKILSYFRKALAQRNIKAAQMCLDFCSQQNLWYSKHLKIKKIKIVFFFQLFKVLKKGDTKFHYLFKL